jgi:CheY-like chemotaxis protein
MPARPLGMPAADLPPTPRHVLVIDDDPGVRLVLGAMVRQLGFVPLLAGSGLEGLALLRAHATSVGCTLIDLTMPEWNGTETRARILAEFPRVPVLLMSGLGERDVAGDVEELLLKPFTTRELETALARKLVRGSVPPTHARQE